MADRLFSVAVADLNGDTVPDLVTANNFLGVTVLLNLCDPVVSVPSVSPIGIALILSLLGLSSYQRLRA